MGIALRLGYLRLRLTLWYGSAFALLLMLHIGIATYVHYRQLVNQAYHAEIQDLETAEGLLYQTRSGQILLNENYFNRPIVQSRFDRLLEVISPDGKILYKNLKLGRSAIDGGPLPDEGKGVYNERALTLNDGRRVLAISHFHLIDGRPIIIRVAYDEAPLFANVLRFLLLLLALAPFTILVAVLVVYRVTRRALMPLSTMVRRAEKITAERLNERLPVHNADDDLGHTARAFNELLQRLEDSFTQLKRFTSDASHELRTPLASLRSIGEVSLRNAHTNEEYREVIGNMLEEVRRLTRLVESLLVISRADSGEITLQLSTFSCVDLIQEVIELVGILAEDKGQRLVILGSPKITVFADKGILRQAVLNLIDNAIKYSPDESEIIIEVQSLSESVVEIMFTDHGMGIAPEEHGLIFDRFYRADEGRSRAKGGTGLGLSIAKWAVEIHKGSIGVDSTYRDGSRFYLRLPVSKMSTVGETKA